MKWTKKDIKTMCGALSTFWLYNRPLSGSQNNAAEATRAYLQDRRMNVVIAGIEELMMIANSRYDQDLQTAHHYETHPDVMGASTPELVDRFTKFAHEEAKGVEQERKLIERIQTYGLPPEVVAFDPTTARSY